jgi:DNA-directed RNA polymerase specialized sigma24 family protein
VKAAAVAVLPGDQRVAFLLREYHDRPDAEMAKVMGCSRRPWNGGCIAPN